MKNFLPAFIDRRRREARDHGNLTGAVLFVDVSGFTRLTEIALKLGDAGAELMSRELTRVFDPMINAVHARGGFIAGFMGDAFTAIFADTPGSVRRAIDAAHEIVAWFKDHGVSATHYGEIAFGVRIGIDHGAIEWGLPRADEHGARTWYFRGAAIEGAGRAQQRAAPGKIELAQAVLDHPGRKDAPGEVEPTHAVHDLAALREFFDDRVLDSGERAELRHVVSLFLRFDGVLDHDGVERVFRALADAVGRLGGVINKLDFIDKGFTALVLFGAPVAIEHAESAAVAFARSLPLNGLLRLKRITVAAGIDAGLVYAGPLGGERRNEWTCLGDAVNTSARLMMSARPGEVMVSERVSRAAEQRWSFTEHGLVELKGKQGRTRVLRPAGLRGREGGSGYRYPMIGRESELASLYEFLSPLWADTPGFAGVIRILGEAGLGKTRLAAALREKLEEERRPLRWITMPCDSTHRGGWNAVGNWLKGWFGISDGASRDARRSAIEARYAELLGDERVAGHIRAELERTMSFAADLVDCHWQGSPFDALDDPRLRHENRIIAIKELVRALAGMTPTVIEIEDAHWMDASTAAWLTSMTRNVADLPLAILCTSRLGDDGARPDLPVAPGTRFLDMDLQPIHDGEFTQRMARALLGPTVELDPDSIGVIHGKAKGNPFFTEQLILHLHETDEFERVKSQGDGTTKVRTRLRMKSTDTARLPGSLSSLVTARIDRLSPDVRETIKHASVLGVRFLSDILGELLKRSGKVRRDLGELLAESEKEGVLAPVEQTADKPAKGAPTKNDKGEA